MVCLFLGLPFFTFADSDVWSAENKSTLEVESIQEAEPLVLQIKSVIASSDDGNIATNVIDSLYETRWSAKGSGEYLVLALAEPTAVGYMGISFYRGDQRSTHFSLLASDDGEEYIEIYKGSSSGLTTELELINFDVNMVKYIKVLCNGNTSNEWNSITEIVLYAPMEGEPLLTHIEPLPVEVREDLSYESPGFVNPDGSEHPVHVLPEPTGRRIDVTAYGADPEDNESNDFTAIQQAFLAATEGDEIYFPNGVYNVSTQNQYCFLLRSGVYVRGEDPELTIIQAEGIDGVYPNAVFKSMGQENIKISNLTITSDYHGSYSTDPNTNNHEFSAPSYHIQLEDDSLQRPSHHITIENMIFENFRAMGVRIAKSHDVVVRDSLFQKATDVGGGGAGYGITIQGEGFEKDRLGYNNDSRYNLVENCTFQGPYIRHGIIIQYYSHNNLVRNNHFFHTVLDAIDLHGEDEYLNEVTENYVADVITGAGVGVGNTGATHDKSGRGNYIHNNTITNSREGVKVYLGTEGTVIENNLITQTNVPNSKGVYLLHAPYTQVRGNTIVNNYGEGFTGVYISSQSVDGKLMGADFSTIEHNVITNNSRGLYIDSGYNIDISSNTIQHNDTPIIDTRNVVERGISVSNAEELTEALMQVEPGDTIYLRDGEWHNQHLVVDAHGTEGAPITIQAETPGSVILTGDSTLRIGADYITVDGLLFQNGYLDGTQGGVVEFRDPVTGRAANYSVLQNSAIDSYNNPNKETDYKWVSLYGTHNRVENCDFRGKNHRGALLVVWRDDDTAQYHTIGRNSFRYIEDFQDNGAEVIRVGTSQQSLSSSFTTVEENLFEQCNGEIEIISNKSGENIYRGNIFLDSAGTLTLRHGNDCIVEENFFFGNDYPGTGGIRIIGENHLVRDNYISGIAGDSGQFRSAIALTNGVEDSPLNRYFQVKHAIIEGNLLVHNSRNLFIGSGVNQELSLAPENITVQDNIIVTKQNEPAITYFDLPSNIVYKHNTISDGSEGINSIEFILQEPDLVYDETYGMYVPSADSGVEFNPRPIDRDAIGPLWVTESTFITRNLYKEAAIETITVPYETTDKTILMGVDSNQVYIGNQKTVSHIKYPSVMPTLLDGALHIPLSLIESVYGVNGFSTDTNSDFDGFYEIITHNNDFYVSLNDAARSLRVYLLYDKRGFAVLSDSERVLNQFREEDLGNYVANIYRVTASEHDGNVPTNSLDGDFSTRWSAEGVGQWIEYDLFGSHEIIAVDLAFFKGDQRESFFEIQYSVDGENFTTLYDGSSIGTTTGFERFPFPVEEGSVTANYIRIVGKGNSANNWNSITEVQVINQEGDAILIPTSLPGVETTPLDDSKSLQNPHEADVSQNPEIPHTATAILPVADGYVELGKPSENFGSSDKLRAKTNSSGSIVRLAYLKFELPKEQAISQGFFELTSKMSTNNEPDTRLTFDIYGISSVDWNESDLTWENSPNHSMDSHEITGVGESAEFITTITMHGLGEVNTYQVDISEYLLAQNSNQITLLIVDSLVQDGNVDFYSKERSNKSHRPYLYIVE